MNKYFSIKFSGSKSFLTYTDCLVAGFTGFLIVYFFCRYSGIGVSPDSIMYASTAQNMHDHISIITFNNKPLTFFPVFYPVFLSFCIFLSGGLTAVAAGPVINGLLFATAIFLTGALVMRFKTSPVIYKWVILAAVLLSPGLQEIYTYLWSETLFIVETLLFFFAFHRYNSRKTSINLVIAWFIAAIACITRYAGVTVVAAGGLLLLLESGVNIYARIKRAAVFGLSGLSLLTANLILNAHNTGFSTGTREPSVTSFGTNLYYFGTVLTGWAGLPGSYNLWATLIAIVALSALAFLFFWLMIKRKAGSYESIVTCFALVYGLFIIISATLSRFEQLSSRLVAPIYIPLLLGLTWWVPGWLTKVRSGIKWLYATSAIAAMLAFEVTIARSDWHLYNDYKDYGVPGYTDDDWNKSAFVNFLKGHHNLFKPEYPIYTDADEAVYLFTGMHSTLLPHRYFKKDVDNLYAEKHFYLIWFTRQASPELIGLNDLQSHKILKKLAGFTDGAVYILDTP